MAKKNGKRDSASQAIRDYVAAHPEAKTKEVAAKMQELGFAKVTPAYVSTIRSLAKTKAADGAPAPKGKPGRPKAAATVKSSGVTLETLLQAKELAAKLGGVAQAQAALEALAKLGA